MLCGQRPLWIERNFPGDRGEGGFAVKRRMLVAHILVGHDREVSNLGTQERDSDVHQAASPLPHPGKPPGLSLGFYPFSPSTLPPSLCPPSHSASLIP